ncbi:MAG: DUF488 domain-containing protein [Candidatus Tectomicrobia bacterium]|uniref:DUF488 domain-containing protein n=1 Tax=Tectimicrobiota bacterium TaxID=2528274 RepID=A0A932I2H6_UNCTE|nr:DUF488 domain-containing protein [Candidatus Tectomicrobia bacterium]
MIRLWTIGHSNHPAERLADLLDGQGVACVVDVRRVPYSRRHPQHGREAMQSALARRGIAYRWEGEALGGKVDWERQRGSPEFAGGLERLKAQAEKEPTAILCAEEDPKKCHRLGLVGAAWMERFGGGLLHIRGNGRVEAEEPPAQLGLFGS